MAAKMKKAGMLSDSKSREILIIVLVIIIVGAAIVYLSYRKTQQPSISGSARLQQAPPIESIPGVGESATPQYAGLVEQSNVQQAEEAAKTGKSAVPTLI